MARDEELEGWKKGEGGATELAQLTEFHPLPHGANVALRIQYRGDDGITGIAQVWMGSDRAQLLGELLLAAAGAARQAAQDRPVFRAGLPKPKRPH